MVLSHRCDHSGGTLASKYGDIKITIPEGAIRDGDTILQQICMALLYFLHSVKLICSVPIVGLGCPSCIIFKNQFKLNFNILEHAILHITNY